MGRTAERSYLIAAPETLASTAADVENIGSALTRPEERGGPDDRRSGRGRG